MSSAWGRGNRWPQAASVRHRHSTHTPRLKKTQDLTATVFLSMFISIPMKLFFASLFLFMWVLPAQAIWQPVPTDTPTPTVSWQNQAGQDVFLSDYKGQVVVLNIWATFCTPCLVEMPTLNKLQRRYRKAGLAVVPVAYDPGGVPAVQKFYRQARIQHLPVAIDAAGMGLGTLAPTSLPMTYVFDQQGQMIGVLDGADDWFSDAAQAAIEALLRQQPAESSTQSPAQSATQPATFTGQMILDVKP